MERKSSQHWDHKLIALYDDYAHGRVDRREFLQRAAVFAATGVTAEALLQQLSPNYAVGQQVEKDDSRINCQQIEYSSPQGGGSITGLLVTPQKQVDKFPAVLVVHENRGLNPHIEDVARRLGVAGFLTLAPDALSPLGGYPGNDDEGRSLQSKRNPQEMLQDFMAGARYLSQHPNSNGNVGVVGFCFGGGIANDLAVQLPDIIQAAVPFYGRQPDLDKVSQIQGSLLLHYAESDSRINAGWPAYEEALKKAGVDYTAHIYAGVGHAFHNDTTPRYDQAAAKLAWERTLDFLSVKLH